jgi:hypothetical protein
MVKSIARKNYHHEAPAFNLDRENPAVRRFILFSVVFGLFVAGLPAADKENKDSPKAAATRKKLKEKISVEWDNVSLKDATDELNDMVKGLGIRLDTEHGVSNNLKIKYKADNKTVADILDGMFNKKGLGYVVVSKPGSAYDGTILIKQGKERGYAAGEEPEKTTAKKDKDDEEKPAREKDKGKDKAAAKDKGSEKPKTDTDTAEDDPEKIEKAAAQKLRFAKDLIKDGKIDKAKMRLEDLVAKYGKTKAADEARELLKDLNK